MTTLEKAAKAMFEQVRARAKSAGLIFGPETQWQELPDWAQKEYTDQVHAVVEELKHANEKILEAGREEGRRQTSNLRLVERHPGVTVKLLWHAMLDAILSEKA